VKRVFHFVVVNPVLGLGSTVTNGVGPTVVRVP
jgi:hypothetical protein